MTNVTDPDIFDPFYKLTGLMMRTVGKTSDSIRLGITRGFDSGEMMDCIYRNRASGRYGIGWLIDLFYLDQAGCRGLRGRKVELKRVLRETIAAQRAQGIRPVIVDVASGPGNYLVETFAEDGGKDITALCRDRDEHGLTRGRALAQQFGVENIRYARGDALNESELRALTPRPTIMIASGFYELLNDDEMIRRQMRLNRAALAPGGAFIFTTQVNHPQLKLIAKTLNNRDGEPWVMKNRAAAQTEGWARDAGFQQISSVLAPPGLYAVAVAR